MKGQMTAETKHMEAQSLEEMSEALAPHAHIPMLAELKRQIGFVIDGYDEEDDCPDLDTLKLAATFLLAIYYDKAFTDRNAEVGFWENAVEIDFDDGENHAAIRLHGSPYVKDKIELNIWHRGRKLKKKEDAK